MPGNGGGGGGDAVTRLLNLQKERCFIVILHPLKSVVVVSTERNEYENTHG